MNCEEKDVLLTKDYCNIINTLNKIISKNIKKNQINNELRKKDYQYFKKKINKNDNYFSRLLVMVINYFLAKINNEDYKKYFKFKNDMYNGYEYNKIPVNYINASDRIDEIIENYTCTGRFKNIYEDADNIAEEIINIKLEITDNINNTTFTLEEIEKFSKFRNVNNDEKFDRLWYILLYIAIHYNTLKFFN